MKGYHPLSNPLAEQKMIRGYISDIVDEKNQKTWKLLPEKTGRLTWRQRVEKIDRLASESPQGLSGGAPALGAWRLRVLLCWA
jgi:hypothetical protein